MKIINTRAHEIVVLDQKGNIIKIFPKSPAPARCNEATTDVANVEGVPIVKKVYSSPYNLPPHKAGTLLIVSRVVKDALPDRPDLVVPAELVRDSNKKVVACKALSIH